ncbi:MAG: ATP-binding protein [Verrucomicrobiota bacterium]
MHTSFIGRREELELLRTAYQNGVSAFIPIYGRRRIGKSELILKFFEKKRGIYFVGKRAQAALQIREFLETAASVLHEPLLASMPAQDWATAFQAVVTRWRGSEKMILALDEFQWMAEASPELPSVLQSLWDRQWKKSGKMMLILCGSYIGFMEREVLGKKSPLFGRRTAQILLQPFNFREAAAFHPRWSHAEHAKVYFLCGGVPLYLRYFHPQQSVESGISANLLNEYAPLYREPDFLLREELREVENYYAILFALASGDTIYSSIARKAGIGERGLNYYLQQLLDLGYVAKRYPLTHSKPSVRHVRYTLRDPLLKFWFRFAYPHVSFIAQMGAERAFKELIRPHLDSYFGSCFEQLAREFLAVFYQREKITSSFQIGEYWDKNTQIDVVGLRKDDWLDLGECKWGHISSTRAMEQELAAKAAHYPDIQKYTSQYHLFTRQTLAKKSVPQTLRCHSLEDFYA